MTRLLGWCGDRARWFLIGGLLVGGFVRRYNDMAALAGDGAPVKVIGETGIIRDKPGFEVDFITRANASDAPHMHDTASVLMPTKGHWKLTWEGGAALLDPGDTALVPANFAHAAVPSMSGEAGLYHIVGTHDAAGLTWQG